MGWKLHSWQVVRLCSEPIEVDDLGQVIKLAPIRNELIDGFKVEHHAAASFFEGGNPAGLTIRKSRAEEPARGFGLDEQPHLGTLAGGRRLDAKQGQLHRVVSTCNHIKFTVAHNAAEWPCVFEVRPFLELGRIAKLERAGHDADAFAGLAGGNVHAQMESSRIEGTAFIVAFAGLDAVENGLVLHFHGWSFVAD